MINVILDIIFQGGKVGFYLFGYVSRIIACLLVGATNTILAILSKSPRFLTRAAEQRWKKRLCPIGAVIGMAIMVMALLGSVFMAVKGFYIILVETVQFTIQYVGPSIVVMATVTGIMVAIAVITGVIIKVILDSSKRNFERRFRKELKRWIM